jgi:hypothetical protein
MPMWVQHAVVIAAVAGCIGVAAVQAVRSLQGRKSGLGSCCAKGCDPQPKASKTVFFPSEMLIKRK